MILKKTHTLNLNNNDIYILETCLDKIIINDNYQGLLLLDNSLNILHAIPITKNLIIYTVYKNHNCQNIMLYCPDNKQIILVDLQTLVNKIISLPKTLDNQILSPNYYWHKDILILTTFDRIFYQLILQSNKLKQIPYKTIKSTWKHFFNFWNQCQDYTILTTYPHEASIIFQKDMKTIGFFNYTKNTTELIDNFDKGWHDIEHQNDFFAFIYEKKIELFHNNNKTILKPQEDYAFLKMRFLNANTIIVLSSAISNNLQCSIETYEIIV